MGQAFNRFAGNDAPNASGNVVYLAQRQADSSDAAHELAAYWTALCDGRIMPDREEIDPRGISGALDRVFLLERVAPGIARFRVAGRHILDMMDMDLRGMPISALFAPVARPDIADAVEAVFAEPARIDLTLSGPRGLLRAGVEARMLLLPLRGRDGSVTRAIGCLSASGSRGKQPMQLRITEQTRRTLIGYAGRDDVTSSPPQTDETDALVEQADVLRDHAREVAERRAALTLVQ